MDMDARCDITDDEFSLQGEREAAVPSGAAAAEMGRTGRVWGGSSHKLPRYCLNSPAALLLPLQEQPTPPSVGKRHPSSNTGGEICTQAKTHRLSDFQPSIGNRFLGRCI